MSATNPRVTVIIPTYNWSSVLPYSIGSVLRQSFADFELLVVGDGCTDDSEQVVTRIADSRVRWINLAANCGHQSGPNNEGLRQARGELIAYLGHDDLWLPHHLEVLVAATDRGADIAWCLAKLFGPDGSLYDVFPQRAVYTPGMNILPSTMLHRRAVIERVGDWKDYREVHADPEAELLMRAHRAGCRFALVPRLGAIKFPAGLQKQAYKIRPSALQAAWTERMVREPDLEAVELARLVLDAKEGRLRPSQPFGQFCRGVAMETGRRIRHKLMWYKFLLARKGSRIDGNRRIKGLPPKF
jgi:glycosyltransferase involved in cell wall biosynthesis